PATYTITASLAAQTADGYTLEAGDASGAAGATIQVEGPRLGLGPGDIVAAYPVPDAKDAANDRLVSIVLRSRTLPWERPARPGVARTTPWVALLLFKGNEASIDAKQPFSKTGLSVPGIAPTDVCDQLVVDPALLHRVMPRAPEL